MRIKFAAILLILILLVSCGTYKDYLTYQNFPIELDGTLTFNGIKYGVFLSVTGPGEGTLLYITPLTLEGYRFDVSNRTVNVTYEGIAITMAERTVHPALILVNFFTFTPEEMQSAKLTTQNGIKLNKIVDVRSGIEITVWLSAEHGTPVRIETDTLSLDIHNFKGNLLNNDTR